MEIKEIKASLRTEQDYLEKYKYLEDGIEQQLGFLSAGDEILLQSFTEDQKKIKDALSDGKEWVKEGIEDGILEEPKGIAVWYRCVACTYVPISKSKKDVYYKSIVLEAYADQ